MADGLRMEDGHQIATLNDPSIRLYDEHQLLNVPHTFEAVLSHGVVHDPKPLLRFRRM